MDKIALIVNQQAKNAVKVKAYLDAFDRQEIQYDYYSVKAIDLDKTIAKAIKQYSLILIGGGDGSIRTAAQYCANSSITLAILPLGTMNHFAKELNLPKDCQNLVEALKKGNHIKIDLAEVNGHVFINNSSLGFYPKFAKKRDYFSKFYNKWLSYIPGLIETLQKHDIFSLRIKAKNIDKELKTAFLMISNNLYTFQFPTTIARESFRQGKLGVYFLKEGHFRLRKIFNHLFTKQSHFTLFESDASLRIEVLNKDKITISLDGDTMVCQTPLIYKSLASALKLLV